MELQRRLASGGDVASVFFGIDAQSGVLSVRREGALWSVRTRACREVSAMTELERECYGVVVEGVSGALLYYFGKEPRRGGEESRYEMVRRSCAGGAEWRVEEAYEGVEVGVYWWEGAWRVCARGCAEVPQRSELWAEVERAVAPRSWGEVVGELDVAHTYQFVLVSDNPRISPTVRYAAPLLYHTATRRRKDHAVVRDAITLSFAQSPRRYDDYSRLEQENAVFKVPRSREELEAMRVEWKGVVAWWRGEFDDEAFVLPTELFIYVSNMKRHIECDVLRYAALYQEGVIHNYLSLYPDHATITLSTSTIHTCDAMYALYHTLATEIFQLFRKCVHTGTGKVTNAALYDKLPPPYRRAVQMTRTRMLRFKRIHYQKLTHRYIIEILKQQHEFSQLVELIQHRHKLFDKSVVSEQLDEIIKIAANAATLDVFEATQ